MINKYSFCHLHRHCEASIQDGVGKVEDGVRYAKEINHPAVAVTDHGNLISFVRFYNEAKILGIKHIFGLEAYLTDSLLPHSKENKEYNHCTILVKNQQGLKNLIKLNNISHSEDGFYYRPRMTWENLLQYKEGLIILSGCVIGRTCQYILDKKFDEAEKWTRMMKAQLQDDYYIELMVSDFPEQVACNKFLLELSRKYHIPGVVTGDAHYTRKEDYEAQKVMMLIAGKATIQELEEQQRRKAEKKTEDSQEEKDKIWIFESNQYWMKDENEMIDSWDKWHKSYYPFQEFENHLNESGKIAAKIEEVDLDTSYKMPKAVIPEGETPESFFMKLVDKGMKERGFDANEVYKTRLASEIKIIKAKGILEYFLVTADIIRWAKDHDVFVGPGRGSAGGSLVCLLLGITELDPIQHGLLFERFLDLGRQEMPDVDTDFEIDRRDNVKEFIKERYGSTHVANIATVGTFHARNIIRDISRVYGKSIEEINEISKLIYEDAIITDGKLFDGDKEIHNKRLDQYFSDNPQIIKIASTLFGQIRHVSKHAAGVIITDKPLDECVPTLHVGQEIMTAWTEGIYRKELSQLNFLKLDILGLKTLSIIKKTCKLIGKDYRQLINLDINDPKVYEAIVKGKLIKGIFQFDSNSGAWLFFHIKPKNFNDIVSLAALDRPGPLDSGMAFEYSDIVHGELPAPNYSHPAVNKVLGETNGMIVFQEQLMNLAKELCGFDPIESSALRKNLVKIQFSAEARKKVDKERKIIKKKFEDRAITNGADKKLVEELWTAMEKFARYGFNKAHSVGYAYISFWTMWLKTYHPVEFYTSLLTYAKEEDMPSILDEMRRVGVKLVHPDVNESGVDFTADPSNYRILFGLNKVKWLMTKAQEAILENRPFNSFEDLCERIPKNILNKRSKEALIRSGAFSSLETDTGKLLTKLKQLDAKKNQIVDQIYYSVDDRLKDESIYLSTIISREMPVKKFMPQVERRYREYKLHKGSGKNGSLLELIKRYKGDYFDKTTGITYERFVGLVSAIEEKKSKSGNDMLFFKLDPIEEKPITFYIMGWDPMYERIKKLSYQQVVGVAIFKRKNPKEFMKITHLYEIK